MPIIEQSVRYRTAGCCCVTVCDIGLNLYACCTAFMTFHTVSVEYTNPARLAQVLIRSVSSAPLKRGLANMQSLAITHIRLWARDRLFGT